MPTCECQCHGQGALDRTCSIEGGCGHLHEERRCASGSRCVRRERDGTHGSRPRWVGALLEHAAGLCPACITRTGHTIKGLALDVVELSMLIGATGGGDGEFVSSTRELPVPIRLGIEALRADIDFELCFWAEVIADLQDAEWDPRQRLYARTQAAAVFLADRVDVLLALGPQQRSAWTREGEPLRDEDGDREMVELTGLDGALRFDELHRRVKRAAGRTKLVHRLTPACPWCDHKTLVRHNGSTHVECETCHRQIDEKHYSWFVEVTIREEKRRQAEAAA